MVRKRNAPPPVSFRDNEPATSAKPHVQRQTGDDVFQNESDPPGRALPHPACAGNVVAPPAVAPAEGATRLLHHSTATGMEAGATTWTATSYLSVTKRTSLCARAHIKKLADGCSVSRGTLPFASRLLLNNMLTSRST